MRKRKKPKTVILSFDQLHLLEQGLNKIKAPKGIMSFIQNDPTRIYKAFLGKKDCFIPTNERNELLQFSLLVKDEVQAHENTDENLPVLPPPENDVIKRKGRGKARKNTPPHSSYTFRITDKNLDKLNVLATDAGLPTSHFVRMAVDNYLKTLT